MAPRELINMGLPEQLAAKKLEHAGGRLPIGEFIAWAKANSIAPNEVFKWGGAVAGSSASKAMLKHICY